MTGNTKVWRAPLAGLASVAMIATMGVAASTANAVSFEQDDLRKTPTFTVTFDAGSRGKIGNKQTEDRDSLFARKYKVDAPEVKPASKDYVFTGWYTAPTGGDRVQFAGSTNYDREKGGAAADEGVSADAITKDVTLYAHYASVRDTDNLVKVSFGATSSKFTAPSYAVQADGDIVVYLEQGDKLASWQQPKDDVVDGSILTWQGADAQINKDTRILPTDTPGVKVTFSADYTGSTYNRYKDGVKTSEKTEAYETTKGGTIDAAPVFVDDSQAATATRGYRLVDQWVDSADKSVVYEAGKTTFSKDTTLVGSHDTEAYQVSFSFSAVNADDVEQYAFDEPDTVYVPAQSAIALPAPNLYDGLYKLGNVYYASAKDNGVDHVYTNQTAETVALSQKNIDSPTASANDHALALKWTLLPADSQQYTVTFDENYGNGKTTDVKVAKDATVAVPATPTRDGYRFLGWYDAAQGGTKFDFNKKITGNKTLYAHWKLVAQYDLNTLLALTNAQGLYTTNSYDAYEKVRADIADNSEKAIYAKTYTWTDDKNQQYSETSGPKYGYEADYTNDYLTDAKVAELTKTLQAAYEKLQFANDTESAFTDVNPKTTPHASEILALAGQGVIKGFDNGDGTFSFGGTKDILRQDYAAFLYRLAGEPEFDVAKATKTFTDVNASTPHYKEILWAASNGVIGGFADGTFRGDQQILRQDAAAMLYNLVKGQNIDPTFDPADEPQFTDVNEATPHYTAIMFLAKDGVIRGFADGSFGGTKTIIRQDAAAFLFRLRALYGSTLDNLYK